MAEMTPAPSLIGVAGRAHVRVVLAPDHHEIAVIQAYRPHLQQHLARPGNRLSDVTNFRFSRPKASN
jgi:hypothetical protein